MMEINLIKGRHILATNNDGTILTDDSGNWFLVDTTANQLMPVEPTDEIMNFFDIDPSTNNFDMDTSTNNSDSSGPSSSTSTSGGKWSKDATLILISLYKENIKNFKSTTIRNATVWKGIAEEMAKNGYPYTTTQVENKFKYLKQRYTKKKDNMGAKGSGESPLNFDYLEEFYELFSDKPSIKPVSVASSSKYRLDDSSNSNDENNTSNEEEASDQTIQSKKIKIKESNKKEHKSKLEKEIYGLGNILKEKDMAKEEAREKRHREKQEIMNRAINSYEKMIEKLIEKL